MTRETERFVRSVTRRAAVPFVPEVTLLTAAEPFALWESTEREAPPFWAFPWAGGQGLARYVLDHPETVAGRHVLDVASGSGLVAIAAAKAGARTVTASDIDDDALAAIALNAAANAVPEISRRTLELGAAGSVAAQIGEAQVVLAADLFYQRELAVAALAFLRAAAGAGATVLAADPGRAFVPADELTPVHAYDIPVLAVLEDEPVKRVTVYRVRPTAG